MTIFILAGLCLVVSIAVLNAPKDGPGRPPLVSAYNLTLGLFVVYIIIPGFLILLNSGEFTWARSYGGTIQLDLSLAVAGSGSSLSYLVRPSRAERISERLLRKRHALHARCADRSSNHIDLYRNAPEVICGVYNRWN